MEATVIQRPDDDTNIMRILEECGLPFSDIIPSHLELFFTLGDGSGLFGVVGLEFYGDMALLRSLAVLPEHRGAGFGTQLVGHAERNGLRLRGDGRRLCCGDDLDGTGRFVAMGVEYVAYAGIAAFLFRSDLFVSK